MDTLANSNRGAKSAFSRIDFIPATQPFTGPEQMALDEVLFHSVGWPTLRAYQWAEATVTFGYTQSYQEAVSQAAGLPLTRRWTGGGMVWHDFQEQTFSLIVPATFLSGSSGSRAWYALLHSQIHALLKDEPLYGTLALVSKEEEVPGAVCFQSPREFDLLLGDQKILGGAMRRNRQGLLYQGSIRVPGLASSFIEQLAFRLADTVGGLEIGADQQDQALHLSQTRYATDEWTRRV